MVKMYKCIDVFKESFDLHGRNVIIYGKGVSALNLYVQLYTQNINVLGFTDSFVKETGTTFAGLKCFTFDELRSIKDLVLYVSTGIYKYKIEILEKIKELDNAVVLVRGEVWAAGEYDTNRLKEKMQQDKDEIDYVRDALCDEKSIKTFDNLLKYRSSNEASLIEEVFEKGHPQYFPDGDIFGPEPGEIFIDAGSYNGETCHAFSRWNENYSKIYLMEPDELMYQVAQEYIKLKGLHDVVFVNKAAYSCSTDLSFKNIASSGSSRIDADGISKVGTISIDEMLDDKKATFIKMDIEGAEMKALEGAEKTITEYRPKLAISIYHEEDDLWKIPFFIKKKYPDYKLYIRHYTAITTETILYAVKK